MRARVDRFEGKTAVLLVRPDEQHQILVPRELMPGVKKGDIIEISLENILTQEKRQADEIKAQVSYLVKTLNENGTTLIK